MERRGRGRSGWAYPLPGQSAAGRLIYLDHSATTPLAPHVVRVVARHLGAFGNPSSLHGAGQEARQLLADAREQVAALFNARPEALVLTASGSEADNLALKGTLDAGGNDTSHLITSRIEHSAVLATCRHLELLGHEVTYLPVDGGGRVDPEAVRRALRPHTRLISIMHANNETGIVQPIEEIGAIAREAGVLFHSDMVQTVGKVPIDLARLPVDLAAFSAHKFYGPKGVGGLVVREGVALQPLIHGGAQEQSLRAGTENVLGIVGLGAAAENVLRTPPEETERQRGLRDRLREGLLALGDVRINGDLRYGLPGVLNASFRYVKGDALATALAFENIAVSTGSACHAHEVKPSHVLVALGLERDWLFSAIRFSLGHDTTEEAIDEVLAVVTRVLGRLRAASPLARKAQTERDAPQPPNPQARIRPSAHPTAGGPFAFVLASGAPDDSQGAMVPGPAPELPAAPSTGERSGVGQGPYDLSEHHLAQIAGASDALAAWRQAVQVLHEVVATECSSGLAREESGGLRFVESIGPGAEEIIGLRLLPGVGCAGFSVERRLSVVVRDAQQDGRFFPGVDEAVGYLTQALLAVPVVRNGHVYGCLEAVNPPPEQPLTEADLARAERVAQALAERLTAEVGTPTGAPLPLGDP